MQRQRGLTLLELLVVLAIIGLTLAGVSLSLRDNRQTQLEREAQRLIALLEAARVQSRTSGMALIWEPTAEGFVIRPAQALPPAAQAIAPRRETWLQAETQASVNTAAPVAGNITPAQLVVLGPEPILAPVRITLQVAQGSSTQPSPALNVGTDGLRPFQVMP